MANIKHTKNELKAQRESLSRFQRFLPMLILKKQQLQAEIQAITVALNKKLEEEKARRQELDRWVKLYSEDAAIDGLITVDAIETDVGNIAGVPIPIFKSLSMKRDEPDLFLSPTWVDDALDMTETLTRVRVEQQILEEQRRLVTEELRTTSQRVNLFEKVKIPECKENLRIIKIFLGDEQTAAVARGKIAKKRTAA